VQDKSVSRKHATIYRGPDGLYYLRDEGSSYGSFVGGKKIDTAPLTENTAIRLGATDLVFETTPASPGVTPRADAGGSIDDTFTILHVLSDGEALPRRPADAAAGRPTVVDQEELAASNQRLQTVYEISEALSSTFDLTELYQKILTAIFQTIPAERANILLQDEKTGGLVVQASMDVHCNHLDVPFSRTIVNKALTTGQSLLLTNAQADRDWDQAKSIFLHNIRSAMCAPLHARDKIIGAINVDASGAAVFSRGDLQLLTLIGNQAGVVIQNARLVEDNIRSARLAAVGQTVASLAHCIKNILQGLKGGASMIDEGMQSQNPALVQAAWPLLKGSQQRITELVMNMLDYSKDRKPSYERADLSPHLENIHALMTERAKDKNVRVTLEIDPRMPQVECDPLAIYRATLNLVTNAIDAVEEETGVVRISARPESDGRHVLISVADNGAGIPHEVQARLFEAFHSTKDSKGTGLGLAVTKKIADEHGGEILIDTEVGRGATFTIRLPVDRAK
jgi:signal transduction histidine kinase